MKSDDDWRIVFRASPQGVRMVLAQVTQYLSHMDFDPDESHSVELVLAETLNNIVKHAYAGCAGGEISLRLARRARGLHCTVVDCGHPMPAHLITLPCQSPAHSQMPLHDLPEGGFGWFLINALTKDLLYTRDGGHNRISFRLAVGDLHP
ncbi:MAG: ATP-binding protein [Paracoccaceae bacterium]